MSPWIRNLSKELGVSENAIKPVWEKAKKIASETFGKSEEEFGSKEYNFVKETVRRMMGFDESVLDPTNFLKSEASAKEYIDSILEVQVSGDFGIDKTLNPPEEETPSEEEEELEITTRKDLIPKNDEVDVVKQSDEEEMEESHSPNASELDEEAVAVLDDLIEKQLD